MKYVGDREVSFIDKEVKKWLDDNRASEGLCLGRFYADFVIENLTEMKVGDVVEPGGVSERGSVLASSSVSERGNISEASSLVELGGTTYTITQIGKKCFAECELLIKLGEKCPLADGVAFGKTQG